MTRRMELTGGVQGDGLARCVERRVCVRNRRNTVYTDVVANFGAVLTTPRHLSIGRLNTPPYNPSVILRGGRAPTCQSQVTTPLLPDWLLSVGVPEHRYISTEPNTECPWQ